MIAHVSWVVDLSRYLNPACRDHPSEKEYVKAPKHAAASAVYLECPNPINGFGETCAPVQCKDIQSKPSFLKAGSGSAGGRKRGK